MSTAKWKNILAKLEDELSRPNYMTWVRPTELLSDLGDIIVISAPNEYAKSWIEQNLNDRLAQLLVADYPNLKEIKIVVKTKSSQGETELEGLPILENDEVFFAPPVPNEAAPSYTSMYTFESLVVGNHNRLAFAAAQVVAEKPGETYNPLFLYGGVGLGKTHLMQAIGHEVARRYPKKKIIYTSCESFASEFIQALQNKSINEFKHKYRSVDLFLVDDIQFLANKEGTQEEFFHTFNMLHQAKKQIVVTADRMPRDIQDLEDRLTSRFGWGMIADIQAPNYETRVAILKKKAEEKKLEIPEDVFDYIANTVSSNVRELEGSLIKLAASATLEESKITKEFTARTLKDILNTSTYHASTKQVIQAVASYFNLETIDLLGKKRVKELVYPRQLVMYVLREKLHQSFPQIGQALGGKDHTTIMHGVNKISELLKTDKNTEKELREIEGLLVK